MSNIFRNPDNLVDMVRQVLSGKPIEEKKKEEELDPVNKQAVKKKFDDRKDKDIDNDGDVDSTDKYLHKRRKAISKSLNEKEPKKKINASHCEEVELGENISDDARELINYAENDGQLYRQSAVPIMKNLTKKYKKDIYDSNMAQKLWKYHADRAAKKYAKENGGTFSVSVRKEVAQQMERDWHSEMKSGNFMEGYEVELDENYRKAALKGIGAETANSIKVGTGVDYYSPKDGSKHMGKITRMDKNGYEVKDDKTGKTFKFKYYSKDAMKEEKRNCGCEQDPCITYGDQTVKEAADEDSDGEKKTAAQKTDMDGDGEKDTGEKKKKKKKDENGEKEDEAKPDKVDTEPEMDNVKTMMSEREMTDKEKAKLDKLKKKYEGGEMHKSMKDQYGDKADEVFYGKLTKMAMGEEIDFNNHVEYLEEKQIDALKKKSEKTGIPYGILKQVYNRGMAAWRTGHRPGTTPQQWAFARVNSFATKSKGTWGGADKDLAAKARGSMKKEEVQESIESLQEAEGSVKVKAGPAHDRKVKSITDLAKKMGLKVTRKGKSDDGKMTTIHLSGNQKKIIDIQALGPRLDEGKLTVFDSEEKARAYAKKNGGKVIRGTGKAIGSWAVREEVELNEDKKELAKISKELEGASKMHKGQSDRIKKMLDKGDMKEAKDGEEKDTNLIMQLRKAVSLRGHTVNFTNGPEKVPANVANAFLMKYAKLKRPAEKDMMTKSGGKSLNHLKLAIKGKFEKPSNPLDLPKMKSEK